MMTPHRKMFMFQNGSLLFESLLVIQLTHSADKSYLLIFQIVGWHSWLNATTVYFSKMWVMILNVKFETPFGDSWCSTASHYSYTFIHSRHCSHPSLCLLVCASDHTQTRPCWAPNFEVCVYVSVGIWASMHMSWVSHVHMITSYLFLEMCFHAAFHLYVNMLHKFKHYKRGNDIPHTPTSLDWKQIGCIFGKQTQCQRSFVIVSWWGSRRCLTCIDAWLTRVNPTEPWQRWTDSKRLGCCWGCLCWSCGDIHSEFR